MVRIFGDAEQHAKWHTNEGALWHYDDPSDVSTAKFLGNFANMPGGQGAIAEVVAVHLNSDGAIVAALQWAEGGTITPDLHVEYLQVLPEDPE